MKKIIALLLTLTMAITLLAGCGTTTSDGGSTTSDSGTSSSGTSENSETSAAQELVIGVSNDVGSLWCGGTATSGKRTMRGLVYQSLFMMDEDGSYLPSVGKEYSYDGNGTYTIEIFDYIYDSEGEHLTASDVIYSLEKHKEDGQEDLAFATLKEWKATGDYTIEITYEPMTLGAIDQIFELCMFTQASYEASGDDMATYPVGTGGYVMTDATMGSTYVFEKRDDFWQTDEQYINPNNTYSLDKVTIRVITDTSSLAVALEAGQIDFSPDITAADYQNFLDSEGNALDGYSVVIGNDMAFCRLVYNCGPNSPAQDENLRKAIAYAIDAAACTYTVHGVFGTTLDCASNPGLKDYSEDLKNDDYFTYNVDLAKQYVEQSSYQGETLKMLVQPNKNITPAATLVQQYCAEIGVDVELLTYEYAQYKPLQWEESGTAWDLQLEGVSSSDQYVYQSVEELDNGVCGVYANDDTLQELYEIAANADTYGEEAAKNLLDYATEHCYIYGLYYANRIGIGYDYVKGIFASPSSGAPIYTSASIEK